MKKAIAFSLALFILIFSLPLSFGAVTANADSARFGKSILSQMDNSAALGFAYDAIVSGVQNSSAEINLSHSSYKLSWDEVQIAYKLVAADYPEFFWLDGGFGGTVDGDNFAISLRPSYTMSGSTLTAAKSALNAKISTLTGDLAGKSDYEKSFILHDRVADAVSYVMSGYHQTAYGALVGGKAVCAGYARAYQLLLQSVGITSFYVTGSSINPATGHYEAHAWNLVSLDGKWYYTDVTWDDQGDMIFYAYLNSTSKDMKEKHVFGDFSAYLPEATATDANYFVKNGLVYSTFDAEKLAAAFKQNETVRVYVSGDSDKFEADFKANIRTIMIKMGAAPNSGYSYSKTSLGRELLLTLNVIAPNHRHSLTYVAKTNPSCSAKGNNEYYTCSCGMWFSDSNAKNEIVDRESVEIAALSHTPSGWKSDEVDHWKECTKCKMETADTKEHHIDSDHNSKCDTCGAALIVAGSGTTINTEKPADKKPTDTSKPTDKKPESGTVSSTDQKEDTSSADGSLSSEDTASDSTALPDDNGMDDIRDNSRLIKIIVIPAVGIAAVTAVVVTVTSIKKKNKQ